MRVIIYVRPTEEISIYEQYNKCANFAKKYGYSIKSKVLDFQGNEFYKAVDKVVFDNEVTSLVVYDEKVIGDYETRLFFKIYLEKFAKRLITCN